MRRLLVIVLTIILQTAIGQAQYLGFKVGPSLTDYSSTELKTTNRLGIYGGLTYYTILKSKVILGSDIIYNQRGFKSDVQFYDNLGTPLGHSVVKVYQNYLSIPLKAGIKFGGKSLWFSNAGVSPSYLLKAKTKLPDVLGGTIDETKSPNRFDFSLLVEAGGEISVSDKLHLVTSLTFQKSLTTISNSDYFASNDMKHYGLTLAIGLNYDLQK